MVDTAVVDYIDEYTGAQPRHIFRLCAMAEKPIPATEPWGGPDWCAERLKENEEERKRLAGKEDDCCQED